MPRANLYDLDQSILARLQVDARTTAETIARDIGLSPAAVQRRIKRLRETGVITREVAVLDPAALGLTMAFVVAVEMERERADVLDAFRHRMRTEDRVQQCYYVTGEHDFLLVVATRDMADFEAFTRRTLFGDPHIRRFTTSVVMHPVKTGQALPLPGPTEHPDSKPPHGPDARP